MNAIQLRIDGAEGYGLPLHPAALAAVTEFEQAHIFSILGLDHEQRTCALEAVAAVHRGTYGNHADATAARNKEVAP